MAQVAARGSCPCISKVLIKTTAMSAAGLQEHPTSETQTRSDLMT